MRFIPERLFFLIPSYLVWTEHVLSTLNLSELDVSAKWNWSEEDEEEVGGVKKAFVSTCQSSWNERMNARVSFWILVGTFRDMGCAIIWNTPPNLKRDHWGRWILGGSTSWMKAQHMIDVDKINLRWWDGTKEFKTISLDPKTRYQAVKPGTGLPITTSSFGTSTLLSCSFLRTLYFLWSFKYLANRWNRDCHLVHHGVPEK